MKFVVELSIYIVTKCAWAQNPTVGYLDLWNFLQKEGHEIQGSEALWNTRWSFIKSVPSPLGLFPLLLNFNLRQLGGSKREFTLLGEYTLVGGGAHCRWLLQEVGVGAKSPSFSLSPPSTALIPTVRCLMWSAGDRARVSTVILLVWPCKISQKCGKQKKKC